MQTRNGLISKLDRAQSFRIGNMYASQQIQSHTYIIIIISNQYEYLEY